MWERSSQAIKNGKRAGTTEVIQRDKPSFEAVKLSLENAISPIANNTKIIVKMLSFKDIKIKFVFTVLLFIQKLYEKIEEVWQCFNFKKSILIYN